jgi:cytidylate kinase
MGQRPSPIIEAMGEAATAAGASGGEPSQKQRKPPRVIAVDGSAASGKSSVGRQVAEELGYPFLDTGVMYRAVTLAAIRRGVDPGDADALTRLANSARIDVILAGPGSGGATRILLDGVDITADLRCPEVEESVSLVSRVSGVREALVRRQREIAGERAIVMAGRDIGTVVLPDADLKVYLDASAEERAKRRYAEFEALGREVTREMVLEDLRRRDRIDSERAVSPLKPAADAVVVNTDGLTQEEVLRRVLALVDGQS